MIRRTLAHIADTVAAVNPAVRFAVAAIAAGGAAEAVLLTVTGTSPFDLLAPVVRAVAGVVGLG